jgi:hypothetical protein
MSDDEMDEGPSTSAGIIVEDAWNMKIPKFEQVCI